MTARPWAPTFFVHKFLEDQGPPRLWGYDGKLHPERISPAEWRQWKMQEARKKGIHSKKQWIELRDRTKACPTCGATDVPLTKDHVFPISAGGCDCIENIQPLCLHCNISKGNSI